MKLGMLQSASSIASDDTFIKEITDDFLNESDSDEYSFSTEDDDTLTAQFPTKKQHRFQDNEAVEVVKMTKIRHHNNGHQTHYAPSNGHCSNAMATNDGYTIADKTRLYKMCEPVQKLPLCR